MSLPPILDFDMEIKPYFGAVAEAESQLLAMMQQWTESQARQFVGHVITRGTITNEFQRRDDIGGGGYGGVPVNVGGSVVYAGGYAGTGPVGGHFLQLDNGFVRSVSDCREDMSALFGQGASDFSAGTALTVGTDFFLELDSTGLSKSGRLIRNGRDWSSKPGTIRITYIAGLSPAELDDAYSFVKQALLEDIQAKFNSVMSQRGGKGAVKKENWVGDYSVEYEAGSGSRSQFGLSQGTREKLSPIKRINL